MSNIPCMIAVVFICAIRMHIHLTSALERTVSQRRPLAKLLDLLASSGCPNSEGEDGVSQTYS